MDFNGKKICIIGFGKSGVAVAKKMLEQGAIVKVSESNQKDAVLKQKIDLDISSIDFEFGGHTAGFCTLSDIIVVSPGVHLDIGPLEEAKKKNIPIISEVELAFMFFKKPVIAITGTNGKTTTTMLVGEILKRAGFRVGVGGNIGFPLISIDDKDLDYIVAEISSYQLEAIENFRPRIAVILNLTPDHLERYKTMSEYGKTKARIFENQGTDDFVIFNLSDPLVSEMVSLARSKKIPFSSKEAVEGGYFVNNGYLAKLNENVIRSIIRVDDVRIKGVHNIENCLAAVASAALCGVPFEQIAKTLKEFEGVEHRIEPVETINNISFINDSKATNPDSTIVALKTVAKNNNVILILGGKDKGTDLSAMIDEIKRSAKEVVLIGEATERFKKALVSAGFMNFHLVSSMEEAVERSYKLAKAGDSVLLSPACASFDMFSDFEHRGKVFKHIVRKIKNEISSPE